MKITVRACVLAAVVLLMGASSVFAQFGTIDAGAPNGSVYNGATAYNFAVNREGSRELFAPVTLCMPGPAGAGTGMATGDLFRIRYYNAGGGASPVVVTGSLTVGTQVTAFQTAATAPALAATANAVIATIPGLPGTAPTTASEVDITITQGITAAGGYPACITISNLRFDVAGAVIQTTGTPVGVVTAFSAIGDILSSSGTTGVFPIPSGLPVSTLATGMPTIATACPAAAGVTDFGLAHNGCLVGTSGATLGTAATANASGTLQAPTGATFVKTGGSTTLAAAPVGIGRANPGYLTGGVALTSTVPSLVQNSGATGTAVIAVQQGGLPAATIVGSAVNIDTRSGGGMFRSNAASGANAASWLISSGATTGSQVEFAVSTMPTGSSVTFGTDASVSNSSGTEQVHLTLVGSGAITAPSGKATYVVTNNITGGTPTQIDVPYSVTVAGTGSVPGIASVIVSVRPAATAGDIPRYVESSTGATGVSVVPNPTTTAVSAQFTWALYNIAASASTRVYPYLLKFGTVGAAASYDTGIVLCNTTGTLSPTGVFSPTVANGSQTGTFAFDLFPAKDTGGAPIHLTSDQSGFPGGPTLGTGGLLAPGNCWQALLSEVLKAANVSGDWKGYGRITTVWNVSSTGFTFISQFANAGGSTMGYVAQ